MIIQVCYIIYFSGEYASKIITNIFYAFFNSNFIIRDTYWLTSTTKIMDQEMQVQAVVTGALVVVTVLEILLVHIVFGSIVNRMCRLRFYWNQFYWPKLKGGTPWFLIDIQKWTYYHFQPYIQSIPLYIKFMIWINKIT